MEAQLKKVASKHSISAEHYFIRTRSSVPLRPVCRNSEEREILARSKLLASPAKGQGTEEGGGRERRTFHERVVVQRCRNENTEDARARGFLRGPGTRVKNKLRRRTIKEMTAVNFGGSRIRVSPAASCVSPQCLSARNERRNCFHQSGQSGQITEALANPSAVEGGRGQGVAPIIPRSPSPSPVSI